MNKNLRRTIRVALASASERVSIAFACIQAAVDALVRHRFELPSLNTLTRLAGWVVSRVDTAQW
jgi:hypothetical protein